MAEKATLFESYLTCHVCSETFRDPVSLGCHHSFCSQCLELFWEQAKNKNCPICRRRSSKDNTVTVNFVLKDLSDSFAERQKTGLFGGEKGDRKVALVCGKHRDEPQLFCEDERRAICPICEFSQHQTHNVVPIGQAVTGMKDGLKADLQALRDKMDRCEQVENTYGEMDQHCNEQLLSTERRIRAEVQRLQMFLNEEEEGRLAALREEEQRKRKTLRSEMKKIRNQVSSLSESISSVEAELLKDNLSFLSSYKDTQTAARVHSSVPDPQTISGALIDVGKHLGNLSYNIWTKMKEQVQFSPVILDPNTAFPHLYLSDDLTSVGHGETKQQLPDNPERHTKYGSLLGCEGFTSGKHTWQVDVGDQPYWNIGVAKESVERKAERSASPKDGIWRLRYLDGKYTDVVGKAISVKKRLRSFRVQLDYDRGDVSFYDSEDNSLICSYRDNFSEKIFPYFNIGRASDAKTADIRVSQVD